MSRLAGLDHRRASGQSSPRQGKEENVWVRKALALLRQEESYSAHRGDRILFGDKVIKEVISLKRGH